MSTRAVRDFVANVCKCVCEGHARDAAGEPVDYETSETLALLLSSDGAAVAALAASHGSLPDAVDLALADGTLPSIVASGFKPAAGLGDVCGLWMSIVTGVLSSLAAASRATSASSGSGSDLQQAFDSRHASLLKFVEVFQSSSSAWLVRPLQSLIAATAALARALQRSNASAARPEHASEAGADGSDYASRVISAVRSAFSACVNQRVPRGDVSRSRKIGALYIAVVLFRMYFKQDALRQCAFFIKAIEGAAFPPLDAFPASQVVTYRAYTGRLALWEGNFKRANEALSLAAGQCHVEAGHNRRIIVTALVPVRMALGMLPSEALLARHGLESQFGPLARALRCGDVNAYDAHMEAHAGFFIRAGIYLLLQQLRTLVYRTLLRRICMLHMRLKEGAQIPLPHILRALRNAAGMDVTQHEVECAIANLIFKKYIRGYLSHTPPVLVLAKTGAFPRVSAVAGAAAAGER